MGIIMVRGFFEDVRIETVRMEDVLVFNGQCNQTSADLVLGDFKAEYLFVRESQLGQHQHIAVMLLELLGKVERIDRCQFDRLRVGSLGLFLVGQLDTQLFDVVGYLRPVLQRVINEKVVTDGIDIIDHGFHAVHP